MDFMLSETQKAVRKLAQDFTETELKPLASQLDRTHNYPKEMLAKMAGIGFTSLNIPEKYGGQGLDNLSKVLVISELAKGCASTAGVIASHTAVNDVLLAHGNESQKKKYLSEAASGKIGAFALTEPDAGSDASGTKTKAEADGSNYIINGTKCFISNMGPHEGDYVVVIARTDPDRGIEGMSAIVVDRDTPGFTLGKTEDKMGLHGADVSELIFEDCRVPRSNLLGAEGMGYQIAITALDSGRIGMAAQALGISEAAIEAAIQYMKERVQFEKPIAEFQGPRWYIADMATRTEAAKALIYEACDALDRKKPASKLMAMCKYYASENAVYVTNKALQLHGGYGYMHDFAIERMYRDARITPLYEGTSEIQKEIIAGEMIQ
ncbi:Acryloyl-CoA reductase (NADH) [bioreactor metagenome]|uniref:Acryloyl-CoA reductase (NADH) n=1 Tax=bioreactor metagenome TaxID=1076179 RepID=A0A644WX89_9ZZZZ